MLCDWIELNKTYSSTWLNVRSTRVISVRRGQKNWRHDHTKTQVFWCSFDRIGVFLSQGLACLRTKKWYSLFCGLFWNNEVTCEATIVLGKRSIVSLDILITLTLYKLPRPLSDPEFCSHERIHFQTSRSTWFVQTHFSGALPSIETENARFQMSTLDHAIAPIVPLSCPLAASLITMRKHAFCF